MSDIGSSLSGIHLLFYVNKLYPYELYTKISVSFEKHLESEIAFTSSQIYIIFCIKQYEIKYFAEGMFPLQAKYKIFFCNITLNIAST